MNRIAGITVAILGIAIAGLGLSKIVPGIGGTGIAVLLLGLLVIGLSFVKKPEPGEISRMSTGSTVLNIFLSPTEVFQNLKSHPRWLVAVILIVLANSIFGALFVNRMTAERIVNYTIDKTLELPMVANSDQARANVSAGRQQAIDDAKNPVIRLGQVVSSFAGFVFLIRYSWRSIYANFDGDGWSNQLLAGFFRCRLWLVSRDYNKSDCQLNHSFP